MNYRMIQIQHSVICANNTGIYVIILDRARTMFSARVFGVSGTFTGPSSAGGGGHEQILCWFVFSMSVNQINAHSLIFMLFGCKCCGDVGGALETSYFRQFSAVFTALRRPYSYNCYRRRLSTAPHTTTAQLKLVISCLPLAAKHKYSTVVLPSQCTTIVCGN